MGGMPCSRKRVHVFGIAADRQDAAGDAGMNRLHAAVQHLGKPGHLRRLLHGKAGLTQSARGPAGGNQFDAQPLSPRAKSTTPVLSVTLSNAR